MLDRGATTLWEHWEHSDDTYSHNHPMFGSVSEWFFAWLAGIQAESAAAGFDRILIRPQPVRDLAWVKARILTVRGEVRSEWRRDARFFTLDVTIPPNTTATVFISGTGPDLYRRAAGPRARPRASASCGPKAGRRCSRSARAAIHSSRSSRGNSPVMPHSPISEFLKPRRKAGDSGRTRKSFSAGRRTADRRRRNSGRSPAPAIDSDRASCSGPSGAADLGDRSGVPGREDQRPLERIIVLPHLDHNGPAPVFL